VLDEDPHRDLIGEPHVALASEFRDLLSARVAEHIKVLRRKIADHGLASRGSRGSGVSRGDGDVRLSDEVAVRILIEHGIITSVDLGLLTDPVWRSRQEDLWWTQGLLGPGPTLTASPVSP